MTSERSPLLSSNAQQPLQSDEPYARYSARQKYFILAQLSWCGLLPFFVSGTFVPSIPQIAKDINADPAIVGLAVGVSVASASIGGFFGASYTSVFGRKNIFLATLPLAVIGSIGVACAKNATQLLFWRFVQSAASSPGRVLGSVIIGDIYKVEERGVTNGIFTGVSLLGCAVAPPLDGVIAYYSSWRITQYLIGVMGVMAFIFMAFFFPETGTAKHHCDESKNPFSRLFRSLRLLRSPALSLSAFSSATALLTDYALLVPFAYTAAARYNITDEAFIGACFIPIGVGNIIAAPIIGRISDRIIAKNRTKNGRWYPEDRLQLAFIGALIPVPLSVVLFGLVTTYINGKIGLFLSLVCLFINGFGVTMAMGPAAAYTVDVMHSKSADAVAATWALRSAIVSIAISWIIPSIEKFGIAITNAGIGIIAWVGAVSYLVLMRYGDELRAWVDVGC